jgi:hypothetical protein
MLYHHYCGFLAIWYVDNVEKINTNEKKVLRFETICKSKTYGSTKNRGCKYAPRNRQVEKYVCLTSA